MPRTKKRIIRNVESAGLVAFERAFTRKHRSFNKYSNKKAMGMFVKELTAKFAPKSVQPQNDYYTYINYHWLTTTDIQQQQNYITEVDDFRLAQDRVYHQLHDIIQRYIRENNDELSKNLKLYHESVLSMNPKKHTLATATRLRGEVEHMINNSATPWTIMGWLNRDEMTSPFSPICWSMAPDEKHNHVTRCTLTPGQTDAIDTDIFFYPDKPYYKDYKRGFLKYVDDVFCTLFGKTHEFSATDVFEVENKIANSFVCKGVPYKKTSSSYNKITSQMALQKFGFDWMEFSRAIGFDRCPDFFITTSMEYMTCICRLLIAEWNTPQWKSYWVFSAVKHLMRITKDWEKIVFDFKGKFERGQSAINEIDAVGSALYMSVPFNTFLTNEYVRLYQNPTVMEYAKTMCEDLRIVFRKILQRNTWLQPQTKKYALKKLDHFEFVLGEPSKLEPDPPLRYGNILYENIKLINDWRLRRFISLEGKSMVDIPQMDWTQYPVKMSGEQAYIVNASYTPSKNSIYINLGYLQKPFVDLDERGIEYNLAHLGFTIAHEMGHGFDDWGSEYGLDGNLKSWWTDSDRKKYKAVQNDVVRQYEKFAARDGIEFDASIGIGEDLADIQGIAICSEYLRDFQEKNNDITPLRSLGFEAFFTYFAFQQKQIVRNRALKAQLKTNPHPLDKYRCNVPLSRSLIFRTLYNVKRGDGMWWHNTNTVW